MESDVLAVPPRRASRLQEVGCAADVGVNEVDRAVDRTIDVALGGEVDHCVDVVLCEKHSHGIDVADVGANKGVARTVSLGDATKTGQMTRVGEGVDVDQSQLRIGGEGCTHEIAADEPGATCDQHRAGTMGRFAHGAYTGRSLAATSARDRQPRSRSERRGSRPSSGQSMPISGSFQGRPRSSLALKKSEHLY